MLTPCGLVFAASVCRVVAYSVRCVLQRFDYSERRLLSAFPFGPSRFGCQGAARRIDTYCQWLASLQSTNSLATQTPCQAHLPKVSYCDKNRVLF